MKFDSKNLRIYLVAGSQDVAGDVAKFLYKLELACKNGITLFQFREKGKGSLVGEKRAALAVAAKKITTKYSIPFVVDDDFDLAVKVKADGIHVGQGDQDFHEIIPLAQQNNMFVGLSISSLIELKKSGDLSGLSYVGCGPIFPTSSKSDAHRPIGIGGLTELMNQVTLPIVAIGGISLENVGVIKKIGVEGVAVISAIMNSEDLKNTIKRLGEK